MTGDHEHGEKLLKDAVTAYEAGDFDACLAMSIEADELFTRLEDVRRATAARQRQAMVWAMNGNLGRAIEINRGLVRIYLDLGDDISAAKCGTNLAYNLRLLGRHHEGLRAYLAAWRVFIRYPDRVFECAMTHMNLAIAYRHLGNPARTYAHSRRGEKLFAGLGGKEMRVIDCISLTAGALDVLDRPGEAERERLRAEEMAERIGSRYKVGSLRHSRGTSFGRRGKWAEALTTERAALLELLAAPALNNNLIQELLRNIARLYGRVGRPEAAWPFALLATGLMSRTLRGLHQPRTRGEWRSRHAEAFDIVCGLLVRRKSWAELAIAIESARAQQPVIDEEPEGESSAVPLGPLPRFAVDGVVLDHASALEAVLADLGGSAADQRDARATLVRMLGGMSGDLVDLRELGSALTGGPPAVWGSIQLRSTLFWYLIDADRVHGGAVPVGAGSSLGAALEELVLPDAEHYAVRVREGTAVMARAGQRLADLLVPRELRRMWTEAAAAGRPRRVVLVPAAEVARLPVAALPTGAGGEPFVRWIRPVFVPSLALAAMTLNTRSPADTGSVLVVADPLGDLPGSLRLTDLDANSLSGRYATMAALSAALKDRLVVTFVYAGHTTSPHDTSRAVLRLADGELSAAEWLTTRGRSDFPMPGTVVLLACASGGLGIADWYGLAAAAITAGATTVVSTLWPHLDSMSKMDRKVVDAAMARGDVVENVYALLDKMSDGRWSPFVWANYAVISVRSCFGDEARTAVQ